LDYSDRNRIRRSAMLCCLLVSMAPAVGYGGSALRSFVTDWQSLQSSGVSGETLDLAELEVVGVTIEAGATAPARRGPETYEELLVVKSGELSVRVGGREPRLLGAGSVAVAYPGERREFVNTGDAVATCYLFSYRTRKPPDTRRGAAAGGSFAVSWEQLAYVRSDIGGRRDMFNRPTAMFDTFEMHVSTLNEGLTNHPAHTHRAEEFVLVIEGEVEMLIGGDTVAGRAGDLIYVESMIPHSLDNTGAGATTYYAFQFRQ
jgi:(S)-ureidoglycine aminohydrolase